MESPAGSTEMVTASTASFRPSVATTLDQTSLSSGTTTMGDDDSDFDTDPDPKDWRPSLSKEERDGLSKKEAQRQDVINGEETTDVKMSMRMHRVRANEAAPPKPDLERPKNYFCFVWTDQTIKKVAPWAAASDFRQPWP